MPDVTIFGFPQSGFTRTALLALEEKGVAYDVEPVEFGSEAHRALHPFARIPILKHGEFILFETSAIIRYVDQVFDGPALQPGEARACARMNQWISSHNDYYVAAIVRKMLLPRLRYPTLGLEVDEAEIVKAVTQINDWLSIAEQALSQTPYFAGDELSLADLVMIPTFTALELSPEGIRALKDTPAIGRWRERMMARPSFAATMPPVPKQSAAE